MDTKSDGCGPKFLMAVYNADSFRLRIQQGPLLVNIARDAVTYDFSS